MLLHNPHTRCRERCADPRKERSTAHAAETKRGGRRGREGDREHESERGNLRRTSGEMKGEREKNDETG